MPVLKTVTISIPWADVKEEFGWTDVGQGEAYARTFILKHPVIIDVNLEFLGVEIVTPDGAELNPKGLPKKIVLTDILYRKNNRYYVVETKESMKDAPSGIRQAEHNARCFDEYLTLRGMNSEVVPVFAAVKFSNDKPSVGAKLANLR